MAHYDWQYMGIPGGPTRPTGMDPNYRDGYRGMRMRGEPDQANYGFYRERHMDDLGFPRGVPVRGRGYDYDLIPARYDPASGSHGGGGMRDPNDPRFLREFNAYAPRQREQWGWHDEPQPRTGPATEYHVRYGNRGVTPGGYSPPWAFGPMRGSRD